MKKFIVLLYGLADTFTALNAHTHTHYIHTCVYKVIHYTRDPSHNQKVHSGLEAFVCSFVGLVGTGMCEWH